MDDEVPVIPKSVAANAMSSGEPEVRDAAVALQEALDPVGAGHGTTP